MKKEAFRKAKLIHKKIYNNYYSNGEMRGPHRGTGFEKYVGRILKSYYPSLEKKASNYYSNFGFNQSIKIKTPL